MQFQKFPLVRIVLCFVIGLLVAHFYPGFCSMPLGLLLVIFGVLLSINHFASAKLNLLFSLLTITLLFQLGVLHLQYFKKSFSAKDSWGAVASFKAKLLESPMRKKNSFELLVEVYAYEKNTPIAAKALLYADTVKGASLLAGDIIWVEGHLPKTRPPANPYMFDYAGYLALQRIHYQKYIGDEFVKIGYKSPSFFKKHLVEVRTKALFLFDRLITNEKARQIAKALVLGDKENLSDEVQHAYANSGAMHVLAVSGLHVGLIYLLLSTVLKRLPLVPKKRNVVTAIVSIIVLFVYALLTGLSPSVFRAFVMFGFFALAKAINRRTNSYNTLAASALVLLLYDPYLLFSLGFQLSYLAVTGIIFLYPKLHQLFEFKHWLASKLWAMTCVSLAAQLSVAPLSMYYFDQFPSYFLITNLFIVPAAFVILLLGLAVLITSPLPVISTFLAALLSWVIAGVNELVFGISRLPFGVIDNIQISALEAILLYALAISLVWLFTQKNYRAVYWAFCFSLAFAYSQIEQRWHAKQSSQIVVYHIPSYSAVEFRKGQQVGLWADSMLLRDEKAVSYHIRPNQQHHFVTRYFDLASSSVANNQVVVFGEKKVLILKNKLTEQSPLAKIQWDLVVSDRLNRSKVIKTNDFVLNSNYYKQFEEDSSIHVLKRDGFYSQRWK